MRFKAIPPPADLTPVRHVVRDCLFCGKTMRVVLNVARNPGHGLYCNKECRWGHHRQMALATLELRIDAEIDRSDPDGCWPWRRGKYGRGYPEIQVNGEHVGVHRWVLERKLGRPLLPGMHACHECDNPPCCREEHLFEGTAQENWTDMRRKGRGRFVTGESHGRAVLTEEQVRWLKAAHEADPYVSHVELARTLGVGRGAISSILSGRNWRHVREEEALYSTR